MYLVHRRDQLRASKIMQQRALEDPKIEIVWNHVPDEVLGNDQEGVTAVRLKSTQDGSTREVAVRRHVPGDRPHPEHGLPERANWR